MNYVEAMRQGARCLECPLYGKSKPVVSAPATSHLRLVVVGEGPARGDEATGRIFSGMGGKLLSNALERNGISRAECHIENTTLCRAESDRDAEKAAVCCTPRLLSSIAALSADTPILTLGALALRAVAGFKNLMLARGFVWRVKETPTPAKKAADVAKDTASLRNRLVGRVVVPALHPQFILRADTWAPLFAIDVRRVSRLAKGELDVETTLDDRCEYQVLESGRLDNQALGPCISLDVETDGIDIRTCNLLCVGLSDGRRTYVIWPWRREYAGPLTAFLKTREAVVCHNGNFDIAVLRNHGVGRD